MSEVVKYQPEIKEEVEQEKFLPDMPISGSALLEVARQAEAYIEAMDKIKTLVLRITRPSDWVDMGGVPYLQATGAEKVARVFGVSWEIAEGYPRKEPLPDGHYMYVYRGKFRLGRHEIEVEGRRSSRDDFFRVRYVRKGDKRERIELPPEEVDEGNVRMAAFTNWINNGIKRLLGLRNLTWEDLEAAGIKRPEKGVNYQKRESEAPKPSSREPSRGGDSQNMRERLVKEFKESFEALGWTTDQGKAFLKQHFKKESAKDLTDEEMAKAIDLLRQEAKRQEIAQAWEEISRFCEQNKIEWKEVETLIRSRFNKETPDSLTLMEVKALLGFLKEKNENKNQEKGSLFNQE